MHENLYIYIYFYPIKYHFLTPLYSIQIPLKKKNYENFWKFFSFKMFAFKTYCNEIIKDPKRSCTCLESMRINILDGCRGKIKVFFTNSLCRRLSRMKWTFFSPQSYPLKSVILMIFRKGRRSSLMSPTRRNIVC